MFFRGKLSGRTEYLQIVKNERVEGRPRQSVVATLGRVDELAQDGTLDRLLRSGARLFCRSRVTNFTRRRPSNASTRSEGRHDPAKPRCAIVRQRPEILGRLL
jgi:hypothetical protein